ncbi:helix-turn-helix transcriptional regulator [Paenibacillus sp. SYP-B3998]|uniref:Helix-turn-helix transcriptional regulator n=1 Tax=Paenibacillus sp. SYP-B3998 TaxID=2678564 RepID=A0A6G4A004_9BACL|nr:helix-turn-helix transcriptional regulator [Paenibacillus sp. SYP-B3998]NEW07695.1 helix-turn-helix transcriptional regulator [Paenibacillus sp. SYP-B3998]
MPRKPDGINRVYVRCPACRWYGKRPETALGNCLRCEKPVKPQTEVPKAAYPIERTRRIWDVKNPALYNLIVSNGLRLSEFAELIGVSVRMVERYVYQGSYPKEPVRQRMADLFDCPQEQCFPSENNE